MKYAYIRIFLMAIAIAMPSFVHAQLGPSELNISGALFNSNGTPVTNSNVAFKLEIYDSASTCILYSEDHLAQDLSNSKGGFALQIGQGSSKVNNIDAGSPTALSSKIFQNSGAIAPYAGCAGGVNLTAGTNRVIRVKYDLGGGFVAMTPDVPMTSAAFSMVADTLQGKTPSNFVQTRDDATYDLNQTNVESIFSAANFVKLTALLSGNASNQKLANVVDPTAASDAATKGYADANVGGKVGDFAGVGPATGDGRTLIWDQAQNKWVTGVPSAIDASKLPLAGGTMTGAIAMGAQNITNIGHMTMAAQRTLNLGTYTDPQEVTLVAGLTAADKGKVWFNTTSNTFKVWDGSAAVNSAAPSGAAGGDLTGTYPNPTIDALAVDAGKIAASAVTTAKINAANAVAGGRLMVVDSIDTSRVEYKSCALNEVLRWEATGWTCVTAAVAIGTSGVTAATYGSATQVPQVAIDAQGRVTSASNVAITFPVVSVAGKTGAVTLNTADITNAGTAATKDFGAAAGNLVELDGGGKIPAGLLPSSAGDIQDVIAGSGLTGGGSSGAVTLSVDTGITTGKIVQMAASDKLPAVDGSNLTNVNSTKLQTRDVAATAPAADQVLTWNNGTSVWEPRALPAGNTGDMTSVVTSTGLTGGGISGDVTLSVDVGVTTGKIVQMAASDKLPAVDGSNLTQINAVKLQTRDVSATVPTANQVLRWNNGTSVWEPAAETDAFTGTVTSVVSGSGLLGGNITGTGTLSVDTGVTNGKIVQVGVSDRLPAIDGRNLTSINAVQLQTRDVAATAPAADQVLTWNNGTSVWEPRALPAGNAGDVTSVVASTGITGGGVAGDLTISVDVGTVTGKIVQMAASDKLPAVDGSNLTNINASGVTAGAGTVGAPSITFTGDTDTGWWRPAADTMAASTAGAERVRITSTGNVGVGTATPQTNFHIAGNGAGFKLERTNGTVGVYGQMDFATPSGSTRIASIELPVYNSALAFYTDGDGVQNNNNIVERMRIDYNGNVGIGTTSPVSMLDVQNPTGGGLTEIISTGFGSGSYGGALVMRHARGTQAAPTASQLNDSLGALSFRGYGATGFTSGSRAYVRGNVAENWTDAAQGTDLQFATTAIGTNAVAIKMTLKDSGNLGIGTTTPVTGARLDITGVGTTESSIIIPRDTVANRPTAGVNGMIRYASDTNKFEAYQNGGWVDMIGGGAATLVTASAGTTGAPSISFSGDSDTGFYSNGANTLGVTTGAATIFNFSSAGLVSPTTGGAAVTTGNGTTGAPTFSFAGDTDTGWWRPAADTLAASTAGTERIRIGSTGNISIGTSSSPYFVTLNGNGARTLGMERHGTADTAGNDLNVRAGGATSSATDKPGGNLYLTSGTSTGSAGSYIYFQTAPQGSSGTADNSPTNVGQIDTQGRLIMGTTNYGGARVIGADTNSLYGVQAENGNASNSGVGVLQVARVRSDATAPGAGFAGRIDFVLEGFSNLSRAYSAQITNGWEAAQTNDTTDRDSYLSFSTMVDNSTNERMRITSGGYVGIGTVAPTFKTEIWGVAGAPGASGSAMDGAFRLSTSSTNMALDMGIDTGMAYTWLQSRDRNNYANRWGMLINPTGGSVGVGNSLPGYQMSTSNTFNGTFGITGNNPANANSHGVLVLGGNQTTVSSGTIAGRMIFGVSNNTSGSARELAEVTSSAAGAGGANGFGGYLSFLTKPDNVLATAERMRINENGNVGIGTTTPTTGTRLDITGIGTTASSIIIPRDTVANRPTAGVNGMIRYASDTNKFEAYQNGGWVDMIGGGAATLVTASAGTTGAPSISFSGDSDTGFYSNGANTLGVTTGAATIFNFSSAGLVSPTTGGAAITSGNGTVGAPALSFAGDTDTGWWRPAADTMAASTAGAERMRIDSAGNVGIGTSNPTNMLDIRGTTASANLTSTSTAASSWVQLINSDTSAVMNFTSYGSTAAGNHQGGAVLSAGLNAISANGPLAIGTFTANHLYLGTNNTNRMIVTSAGNVGIGTTSPAANLEVSAADTATELRIVNTSSTASRNPGVSVYDYTGGNGGSASLRLGSSRGTAFAPAAIAAWDSLGAIHFRGQYSGVVGDTASAASIYSWSEGAFTAGSRPAGLHFYTTPSGSTSGVERLSIEAGGDVGIGTDDPGYLLHVFQATAGANMAYFRNAGNSTDLTIGSTGSAPLLGSGAGDSLQIYTNNVNTQGIRIDTLGNVGIGTTTPGFRLSVLADDEPAYMEANRPDNSVRALQILRRTRSDATNPSAGFGGSLNFQAEGFSGGTFGTATIESTWENNQTNNTTDVDANLKFSITQDNSTIERMRITSSGNVGIGSTVPVSKLDVNGTITATGFSGPLTSSVVSAGAGTAGAPSLSFSGDTDTGFYNASSNNTISVTTGNSNIFNFSSAGLVSPTTGGGSVSTGNGTTGAPTFSFAGDTDTGWWRPAADTMAASTAGVERMRIESSGYVGIGTTNPLGPLHVTGGGISRLVRPDPTSNTYINGLYIDRENSAGVGAANIGTGFTLRAESSTEGNISPIAQVGARFSSATAGSENGDLFFYTSTLGTLSEKVRIDSAGNVGIGTTAPASLLDVRGSSTITSGNYENATSVLSVNPAGASSANYNSMSMVTQTNGAAINYTGIVFGGSTSATHAGTGTAFAHYGGDSVSNNFSTGTITNAVGFQGHANNSSTGTITTANGGNFYAYNATTGSIGSANGSISSVINNSTGTITNAYAGRFAFTNAGTITNGYGVYIADVLATNDFGVYQLGADDVNYFAGSVGIGTIAPAAKLEIIETSSANIKGLSVTQISADTTGSAVNILKARGTVGSPAAAQSADTLGIIKAFGHDGTDYGATSTASLRFLATENFTPTNHGSAVTLWSTPIGSTVSAERVRIDSAGNVGIGTTSPASKLQINGDVGLIATAAPATPASGTVKLYLPSSGSGMTRPTVVDSAGQSQFLSGIINRAVGNPIKTVSNSAAETSMYTAAPTIKGGTLGTDRMIRVTVVGDFLNNTGAARGPTIRFKYGGTTFATLNSTAMYGSNATRRRVKIEAIMSATGATNSQAGYGNSIVTVAGDADGAGSAANNPPHISGHTSMTVDSTADQTFDVTVQLEVANASLTFRPFFITIELL